MRGDSIRDRDALEHAIRNGLGVFLHECEGAPPALVRVTVEYEARHRHDVIHCVFSPDQHFFIAISDRGERLDGRWADLACELTRQLYSRLFEDHMVNLEVRVVRLVFEEAPRRCVDPAQLRQLHDQIVERERHIRRHHHGITPQALGVPDRATTATEVRARRGVPTHVRPSPDRTPAAPQIDAFALRMWAQQLSVNLEEINIFGGIFGGAEVGGVEAQRKGLALLKENLTPVQLEQYEKRKHFEVVGCDTRKLYRIRHGRQMNIEELDKRHRRVCGWCFLPTGALVAGDVMLAQKIALETNETAALKIANRFG